MNKTTLEGLEEALERLEQIDGKYSWGHLLFEVREALSEPDMKECRHCGFLCKPNPDESKPWYPLSDHIPDATKMVAEPVKQEPVAWCDHVEHRLLTWRQSFVNRSGDQLALDDFMDQRSLEDLIDFVCDEYTAPTPRKPEPVEQEPVATDLMDMLRLIETIKYLRGIAERGLGREIREDETIEQFVLGYVKQLESTQPVKQEPVAEFEVDIGENGEAKFDSFRFMLPKHFPAGQYKLYAAPADARTIRAPAALP